MPFYLKRKCNFQIEILVPTSSQTVSHDKSHLRRWLLLYFEIMESTELEIGNDLSLIDKTLKLHNDVFEEKSETVYNSREEWIRRINNGGYFIYCKAGSEVVGYAVCDVVENGDLKIWLAGVDSKFRKQGIWSRLYEGIKSHAVEEGRSYILLNTKPTRFPAMYAFLQSKNAEIYKKEMHDGEEKVFAKIPL